MLSSGPKLFFLLLQNILQHSAHPRPIYNVSLVSPEYARELSDVYLKKLKNFHLHKLYWREFPFLQFYKKCNHVPCANYMLKSNLWRIRNYFQNYLKKEV